MADDLSAVVDGAGVVSCYAAASPQITEVDRRAAVFPQQSAVFGEIQLAVRIEGCAGAGGAYNLALIIDPCGHSVGVPLRGKQSLRLAVHPNHWFELMHRATRLNRVGLGKPYHFALVVNPVCHTVRAA
jgi:hypothetical protein